MADGGAGRHAARRAVEAVTAVAFAAISESSGPDPGLAVLAAVQAAIGADIGGFYSHEWRGWTTPLQVTPSEARPLIPYERVPTAFALPMHPAIRHLVQQRPVDPFRITDLVADRVWQSSALASRMRPEWGRNQQLHIPVAPGYLRDESRVWVLARTRSAFTDRDLATAAALAPVLTAFAHHLAVHADAALPPQVVQLLTPREVAVLRLIGEGSSSGAIGLRLGMSMRTAQKHTEHIRQKLGVHTRLDAVRAVHELGVGDPARRRMLNVEA
jgi:DNA-binding CsgD family transcriptional regulator